MTLCFGCGKKIAEGRFECPICERIDRLEKRIRELEKVKP
jgi:hypothetical protein